MSELLSREETRGGGRDSYDYDSLGSRQGQATTSASGATTYHGYGKDANGSVETIEDENGAVDSNDRYVYDPYGQLEDPNTNDADAPEDSLSQEAQDNPFRFEGFYYDSGVESYDMQAREYRPEVGRFLSQDRFAAASGDMQLQADPLTQDRYAFAGGNPVSNIEFDGHFMGYNDMQPKGRRNRRVARRAQRSYEQSNTAVEKRRYGGAKYTRYKDGHIEASYADGSTGSFPSSSKKRFSVPVDLGSVSDPHGDIKGPLPERLPVEVLDDRSWNTGNEGGVLGFGEHAYWSGEETILSPAVHGAMTEPFEDELYDHYEGNSGQTKAISVGLVRS